MNMSNAEADVQYSAWSGLCYVTPLLGGYIADVYLGRYWTILVSITSPQILLLIVVNRLWFHGATGLLCDLCIRTDSCRDWFSTR